MYAETGLMFQALSPDFQQFCDLSYSHKSNGSLGISDYDLGGEGDLFNAPEPIMEQPVITINPMTVINGGEDDLCPEHLDDELLLVNVFREYKEILETETSPLSEILNYKFPVETDEISIVKESVHPPGQITKSMSFNCLNSMNRVQGPQIDPGLIDISEVDFGNVFIMRRAFSDGDIKTLANGDGNHRPSSLGQPQMMSDHIIEDRWQKLSRYRNKKKKRNFGKKIKYACRKALADTQPRIRGRFAKTVESNVKIT